METKRLILRGWNLSDLTPFLKICSRQDVMKYIDNPWETERVTEFILEEQRQLQLRGHCRWALELKDSSALVGFCGFRPRADKPEQLEIGWRLHPDYWRQGLAYEAATKVMNHATNQLTPTRIFARIHVHNKASLRLANKLGMQITKRVPTDELDDYILEYPCSPILKETNVR